MLRLLLALTIVLLPNALHVPANTGVPGLNVSNLLLLLLLAGLVLSPREPVPVIARSGYLTPPLISLFAVLVMGFVMAQWQDLSRFARDLTDLKNAIFYPLFYFVYRRCRQDLQGTRQLILLVLVVAVVAAVEAIYQGVQFGLGAYEADQRATGPFGELSTANRAGVFYAMFLPMFGAIALLMHQRTKLRMAALVGCVLLIAAILFTYSRQAYLIALVAVLALLLHRSVLAAVLAALLLLLSASFLPDSVTQRVEETRQVDATGTAEFDNSTASRFDIWKGAIEMWRDHPAGVGSGRFNQYIGDYSGYAGVDAHNMFVLMLAECGPLGLGVLLWLFWRLWGLARKLRLMAAITDPEARALALGFTLTVIAMALSNVYGSPFFHGLIMANFWVLCGLLERYGALKAHAASVLAETGNPAPVPTVRMADRFPLAARAIPGSALVQHRRW
jgi:O-antigen ligase